MAGFRELGWRIAVPRIALPRFSIGVGRGWWRRLYDALRLNVALYPGIVNYRAAHFLRGYYAPRRAALGWPGRALNLVVWLGFQAWLPRRARKVALVWGFDRRWARRATAICRTRFADPNDIALFRISRAEELDDYMRRFEHIGVGRAIAHAATDHDPLLTDKRRFYRLCMAAGVPHPRCVAILSNGRAELLALPEPGRKLFLKPACGSGGAGARSFVHAGGDFRDTFMGLPEMRGGTWIVQQRLDTHPALRDIALSALPTARITTMLDEAGRPEIVTTVLRVAADGARIVDNIGVGGLSAPIDLATGMLGPACGGMRPGEYARHPATGAAIEGRIVPDWAAMTRLVLDVHARHFSDHVMIGWDVAAAAEGPCLLEANPRPSIIMAQRATRTPVGRTRMGALIAHHLERRLAEGKGRPRFVAG